MVLSIEWHGERDRALQLKGSVGTDGVGASWLRFSAAERSEGGFRGNPAAPRGGKMGWDENPLPILHTLGTLICSK